MSKITDSLYSATRRRGASSHQEPSVNSDQIGCVVQAGHVGAAWIAGEFHLNSPELLPYVDDEINLETVSRAQVRSSEISIFSERFFYFLDC